MEHKNHDKVFFINFSVVLGALGTLALIISVIARALIPHPEGLSKEQAAALDSRVAPVTRVFTDPQALLAATAKPARAAMSGDEIVTKVCSSCHGTGVLNAPKIGDASAWGARSSSQGGVAGLTTAAIKGVNSMPPRGGDPDLSDDEVRSAVEVMLKKSGG